MASKPVAISNLDCGPIYAHAFNKNRTQLAVAPGGEVVLILELVSGKWVLKHTLKEHDMLVTSLDWAPNTNRIVTCSQDKNAYVWTYENGAWTACLVLARLAFGATCVKWSPLENKFAVGSSQKVVSICHYEKDNNWWVAKHIKNNNHPICSTVSCISWHPQNVLLAVGSFDYKARVFSAYIKEVDTKPDPNPWGSRMPFGELMAEYKATGWVKSVGFSPSGCRLSWITHDSTVNVVSADVDKEKVLTYRGTELPLRSLLWASENTFITAGFDCIPYVFSVNSSQITKTAELDVKKDVQPQVETAMSKFQNLDRMAGDDLSFAEKPSATLHDNCITDLQPFDGTAKDGVKSFSSVGLDSQLIIWPIKETIEYLWGTR